MSKSRKIIKKGLLFLGSALVVASCGEEAHYFPKPLGFYRIDLPTSTYRETFTNPSCPFTFELSKQAILQFSNGCNHDIYYPQYKARLYGTYLKLHNKTKEGSLLHHTEFSRKLAYEHSIKADQIIENRFANDTNKVYGISYNVEGNVATNFQFYLTDSATNFYRGALYFESAPNIDSIKPVLNHIKTDLQHLMETFEWR